MRHDLRLRAAARRIYDIVYPEDFVPITFEEAERYGAIYFRRVVEAAMVVDRELADPASSQLQLF